MRSEDNLGNYRTSQLLPLIGLFAFLLCNAVLVWHTTQGRSASFVCMLLTSVLATGLWGNAIRHRRLALLGLGMLLIVAVTLIAGQALLQFGSQLGVPSFALLGTAIILSTSQPLLVYGSGNLIWRKSSMRSQSSGLLSQGSPDKSNRRPSLWLAWVFSLATLVWGIYLTAVFTRPGLLGWDTPNYVWRSRLANDFNGLIAHVTNYDTGLHIVFPLLSALAQRLTLWSYWDVVVLVPTILVVLGCLALGALVYRATRSWLAVTLAVLFMAAFFPMARFSADLRDNLTALVLGTTAMAFLSTAEQKSRNSRWKYELAGGISLILTGFAHISISVIFFLAVSITYMMEFLACRLSEEGGPVLRDLYVHLRIPVICALIVGACLLPTLPAYLESLVEFGIATEALGNSAQFDLSWLMANLEIATYWPWVLVGLLDVLLVIVTLRGTRSHRLLFAWAGACVSLYLFLPGRLPYRYFLMIPFPAYVALGVRRVWTSLQQWPRLQTVLGSTLLLTVVLGLVFPANIAGVYDALHSRPVWVRESTLQQIDSVNQYITTKKIDPPYVFLVEQQEYPFAFSILWQNTVRAAIISEAILETYLYFGNLESFLRRERTFFNSPEQEWTSNYWWQLMDQSQIVEKSHGQAFILEDFNSDLYDSYLFQPSVDLIAPGVLLVDDRVCRQMGN